MLVIFVIFSFSERLSSYSAATSIGVPTCMRSGSFLKYLPLLYIGIIGVPVSSARYTALGLNSRGVISSGVGRRDSGNISTQNKAFLKCLDIDFKNCDILLSNSKWEEDVFKSAFRYKGKIQRTGHPRNDIFFEIRDKGKNPPALQQQLFRRCTQMLQKPLWCVR